MGGLCAAPTIRPDPGPHRAQEIHAANPCVWGWILHCHGGCPLRSRMFSSFPLGANSNSHCDSQKLSQAGQIVPGGGRSPLAENRGAREGGQSQGPREKALVSRLEPDQERPCKPDPGIYPGDPGGQVGTSKRLKQETRKVTFVFKKNILV